MKDIKTILAALAFGEYSRGVFGFAARLAGAFDADLIVANVINIRDVESVQQIESMGYKVSSENYVRGIREEREKKLAEFVKETAFPEARLKTIFKVGNPIDALLRILLTENIDMAVMGPKGRTDLQHILLGSVAEKMLRRSPVTIVSYRDEQYAERMRKRIDPDD